MTIAIVNATREAARPIESRLDTRIALRVLPRGIGSLVGVVYAAAIGAVVYGVLKAVMGLRLTDEEQRIGADLTIHKIGANPERDWM